MYATKEFKYVDYLWDDGKAQALENEEIALLLYRSNILGADLRITNYGGGNTSCKTTEAGSVDRGRNRSDVGQRLGR